MEQAAVRGMMGMFKKLRWKGPVFEERRVWRPRRRVTSVMRTLKGRASFASPSSRTLLRACHRIAERQIWGGRLKASSYSYVARCEW